MSALIEERSKFLKVPEFPVVPKLTALAPLRSYSSDEGYGQRASKSEPCRRVVYRFLHRREMEAHPSDGAVAGYASVRTPATIEMTPAPMRTVPKPRRERSGVLV